MKKQKWIYVVYGKAIERVFDNSKSAHQFALEHNLEHENWKSIDTKWWVNKWPTDKPVVL